LGCKNGARRGAQQNALSADAHPRFWPKNAYQTLARHQKQPKTNARSRKIVRAAQWIGKIRRRCAIFATFGYFQKTRMMATAFRAPNRTQTAQNARNAQAVMSRKIACVDVKTANSRCALQACDETNAPPAS
jgi:hypothetical protein